MTKKITWLLLTVFIGALQGYLLALILPYPASAVASFFGGLFVGFCSITIFMLYLDN